MTQATAYASTGANNAGIGSFAVTNPTSAQGAPNGVYASFDRSTGGFAPIDTTVQLSLNVGGVATPSGTNLATSTILPSIGSGPNPAPPLTLVTYNPGNNWGNALTSTKVNDSLFGLFYSLTTSAGGTVSNYIQLTGYTFSPTIPGGSLINFVKAVFSLDFETNNVSLMKGTLVDVPGGRKRIEDTVIGELVDSFWRNRVVKGRIKAKRMALKEVIGIRAKGLPWVFPTLSHRFYIGCGQYRTARHLDLGDTIFYRDADGVRKVTVWEKARRSHLEEVVTIEVEGVHNFFANGYAVHNIVVGGGGSAYMDAAQLTVDFTPSSALPELMMMGIGQM